MSAGIGLKEPKPRRSFRRGFTGIDAPLTDPILKRLSYVELRVYVAAINHCRGRDIIVNTRQLGEWSDVDHARVCPALYQLEALHLIHCHRSPRGTRIEILDLSDEALEAVLHREASAKARRAGKSKPASPPVTPAAPASEERIDGAARVETREETLPVSLATALPETSATPATVCQAGAPEVAPLPEACQAEPAEAAPLPEACQAEAPEACEAEALEAAPLLGPATGPAAALPAQAGPPAIAAAAALPGLAPETASAAWQAPASGALGAPLGGALGAPLGGGAPNYVLDRDLQIPPSLPSPSVAVGACVAADGREGGKGEQAIEPTPELTSPVTEPPSEPTPEEASSVANPPEPTQDSLAVQTHGDPPSAAVSSEGKESPTDKTSSSEPASPSATIQEPARPALDALAPLLALARTKWPSMSPKALQPWLERGAELVTPGPTQAEMEAAIEWAATEPSLATAKYPLAAAMTADRFEPWLKRYRAEQQRLEKLAAARAKAPPAPPRPAVRGRPGLTAEEREKLRAQGQINQEMARAAIAALDAARGSGQPTRRPLP